MQDTITAVAEPRISHLLELAIKGLESMYDPEKRLFCHRLQKTSSGLKRKGISHRYTIMTLLGFLRAESAGLRAPIDIEAAVDRLTDDPAWLDNIGDLGLLLWLCAAASQKHLERFHARFDLAGALENYPDVRCRRTMELSWFLTGIAQARGTDRLQQPYLAGLARETYRLLLNNQGRNGLFGHMARWTSLAGVVRGRVGSFADQVYPILAMARFSRAFDNKEARHNALHCAYAICRLQGLLGQWWWHYDSVTGRVVEQYPVYSVHQHAMAPMALFELQDLCGADFREHIRKGLAWINGNNEVGQDFKDQTANVIWRSLLLPKTTSYPVRIGALLGKQHSEEAGSLQTLFECRPYELGWLLYAMAGRDLQLATRTI
jgi:hypothetical protein